MKRYPLVDQLRTMAILLMVFFHLFYDLNIFGFVQIDFQREAFWFILPRIIVFLFLFCVGISLAISHSQGIKWRKFTYRFLKILFFALLISIFTYFVFPQNWVYFGTLHCIAISSLLALPFIKYPRLSLLIGLALLASALTGHNLPWPKLSHNSMDYIPIFPWLGVVLGGIAAFHWKIHTLIKKNHPLISYVGRHSLLIYLLHQPLLYGMVLLLSFIRNLK